MARTSRPQSRRYLELKRRKWWADIGVPADVRHFFGGSKHYRQNLQTSDLRVAMVRRDEFERAAFALFDKIRRGEVADEHDPAGRGARWREELARLKEKPQSVLLTPPDPDQPWLDITDYDLAVDAVQQEAEKLPERDHTTFMKAFTGQHPVNHYLDAYLAEAGLAPKTTNERRGLINRFAAWCQTHGLSLLDIDRKAAGRYVSTAIAPMHPRTAKKHMTAIKEYWSYLARRGHVPSFQVTGNPWSDQLQPQRGRRATQESKATEREFTTPEVRALLSGPASRHSRHDESTLEVLTVGLLSGMREAEIVTLQVGDLKEDAEAGPVFDLREAKSSAGLRRVPVHPDLTDLIARRTQGKASSALLFDEYADMLSPSDTFGKRFKRYREARGVGDKRADRRRSLVNFHSARRWFVTEAEKAGIPETTVALVVGHVAEKRKGITFRVYSGGPGGDQRRACVEAVSLPARDGPPT